MEYDIIIHGKVTTREKDKFQNSFNKLLDETKSSFKGSVIVYEFTEYEEVKEDATKS